MSEYTITEFQPQYQDQVIRLIDSILKELGVIPNVEEMIDDPDLFRIPEIYAGKGRFWLALAGIGAEVVGTVALRDLGNGAVRLNRMFVVAEYRGTRLGQALLDTALAWAKANQFHEISLNTHHLMTRAHRFYEKNGFQRASETSDSYTYRLSIR